MRLSLAIALESAGCFSKPAAPAADAPSTRSVAYVHSFGASSGTFTAHAVHANDLIVFALMCDNPTRPTSLTLSAAGWAITPVSGVFGLPRVWVQILGASAPNTDVTTFSPDPQSSCNFEILADEFQDPSGGGIGFDVNDSGMGMGDTSGMAQLTTAAAGDAIWAACFADGDCGAVSPFTAAMTTDNGNLSEYRAASDPVGTMESASFTVTTTGEWVIGVVAIKPE